MKPDYKVFSIFIVSLIALQLAHAGPKCIGSVKDTGANKGSKLVGCKNHNDGLVIMVFNKQEATGARVEGGFKILDAGTGIYSNAIKPYVGQVFDDASQFFKEINKTDEAATHTINRNSLIINKN